MHEVRLRKCKYPGCRRKTANLRLCDPCLAAGRVVPTPKERRDWNAQVRLALAEPPGIDIPTVILRGRAVNVLDGGRRYA